MQQGRVVCAERYLYHSVHLCFSLHLLLLLAMFCIVPKLLFRGPKVLVCSVAGNTQPVRHSLAPELVQGSAIAVQRSDLLWGLAVPRTPPARLLIQLEPIQVPG